MAVDGDVFFEPLGYGVEVYFHEVGECGRVEDQDPGGAGVADCQAAEVGGGVGAVDGRELR